MANMSYCRFRNTLNDLHDCHENLWEPIEDKEEFAARRALVELAQEIVNDAPHVDELPRGVTCTLCYESGHRADECPHPEEED